LRGRLRKAGEVGLAEHANRRCARLQGGGRLVTKDAAVVFIGNEHRAAYRIDRDAAWGVLRSGRRTSTKGAVEVRLAEDTRGGLAIDVLSVRGRSDKHRAK